MKDHRRTSKGNLLYLLGEIFFLTLVALICGCDSWESIDMFAKLDSAIFGQCFISWANGKFVNMENEVINIDGKRLCGSYDTYLPQ